MVLGKTPDQVLHLNMDQVELILDADRRMKAEETVRNSGAINTFHASFWNHQECRQERSQFVSLLLEEMKHGLNEHGIADRTD